MNQLKKVKGLLLSVVILGLTINIISPFCLHGLCGSLLTKLTNNQVMQKGDCCQKGQSNQEKLLRKSCCHLEEPQAMESTILLTRINVSSLYDSFFSLTATGLRPLKEEMASLINFPVLSLSPYQAKPQNLFLRI